MSNFIFTYRAPTGYTPGGSDAVATWRGWFESMGTSLVDLGHPVFERSTMGNVGAETQLGGYSLVTADDLEVAVALAKDCPFLQEGGGVEVGELADLP